MSLPQRWAIVRWSALAILVVLTLTLGAGTGYQYVGNRRDLARHPAPGELIAIGGHRLHLWCTGAGSPVAVLDAGLGGSSLDWSRVQPDVAGFTRVCSYDRAGMGWSDVGPSPRTGITMARELH